MKHTLFLIVVVIISFQGLAKAPHAGVIIVPSVHKDPFDALNRKTFTGYIVHDNDTLRGLIEFKSDVVRVKDALFNTIAKYPLDNKRIHCIDLTNNAGNNIHLMRLKKDDGRYYRIVHQGKLTLYDRNFVFSYQPEDITMEHMYISYNGKIKNVHGLWALTDKRALIQAVNETYGTNLEPRDYTKDELLAYVLQQQ